jgi:hypothetical protein
MLINHRARRRRRVVIMAGVIAAAAVAPAVMHAPPASAASATVTAQGRFVYVDDKGNEVGITNAKVDMCDEDFPGCGVMGSTSTDSNGFFTVTGSGWDWFGDLPDPRVKVIAESPAGHSQTGGYPYATYCFQSNFVNNAVNGSTIQFGTVSTDSAQSCDGSGSGVAGEAAAWQLHNNIFEAWTFARSFSLANPGVDMPPVDVHWPSGGTFYNGGIAVAPGDEWKENVVWHEYGHHVMGSLAESPWPWYQNGHCDGFWFFEAGHCLFEPELGEIHFTEGWPSYFADALASTLTGRNTWGLEFPPHPAPFADPVHTEGYTAAILWDLHDAVKTPPENFDGNGSADRLAEGFATQWAVLMGYDPDPTNPGHNHPTTILEFWDGVRTLFPQLANRLSAIYDENEITGQPAVDLVTSVTSPPASIVRGNTFRLVANVHNVGAVNVGEPSSLELFLSTDGVYDPSDIALGNGAVTMPDVAAGQSSPTDRGVEIPATTPPGVYYVLACADRARVIFETNDANNCTTSLTPVKVAPGTPDRKLTVWRPSTGNWYTLDRASGVSTGPRQWGLTGDQPVSADYDGDGKLDTAVWRPSSGNWYVIPSSTGVAFVRQWGLSGDVPVPADYDRDGKTDFAVWRPSSGNWYVIPSSTGVAFVRQWGLSGDVPVPADYDGDGKTDFAVWRQPSGNWYVIPSSTGVAFMQQWGVSGDVPVPADYDGDGKADLASYRPSQGNWYTMSSLTNLPLPVQTLGSAADIPVPADQDGDGQADRIVFTPQRPQPPGVLCTIFGPCWNSYWIGIDSHTGIGWSTQWGRTGDVPIPHGVI